MIYVYRVPAKLSDGFCFNGGNAIPFTNVDWFDNMRDGATRADLERFISGKRYADAPLLVLQTEPFEAFVWMPRATA